MKIKKLTLHRETLAPLNPSDLHHVHGGYRPDDGGCIPDPMRTRTTGGTTQDASRLFCIPTENQPAR